MGKLLCCEGVQLKFKIAVPAISGVITVNPPIFPTSPSNASSLSNKVKTGGKKLYREIGFTITGATNGTCVQSSTPVYGKILGGTAKTLVDSGSSVVTEEDESTVLISGTVGSSPCSFNATVQVENTGQSKVKGE